MQRGMQRERTLPCDKVGTCPSVGERPESGTDKKVQWAGQHKGTHVLDSGAAGIKENPPRVSADPVTRGNRPCYPGRQNRIQKFSTG